MSLRDEARASRYWDAWVGDVSRLQRLAKIMDDLIDDKRQEALAAFDPNGNQASVQDSSETEQVLGRLRRSRMNHAVSRWRTELTATERDLARTRTGDPQDVLEATDPAFVKKLTITAPSHRNLAVHAEVSFSSEGCELEVQGDDIDWVRSALSVLEAEVSKDVPWWAWMRSEAGAVLYFLIGFVAGTAGTLVRVDLSPGDTFWFDLGAPAGFVGTFAGLFVSWIFGGLSKALLPPFEIVTPNTKDKGSRALAFLGTMVASVVVGFVVNLVSS